MTKQVIRLKDTKAVISQADDMGKDECMKVLPITQIDVYGPSIVHKKTVINLFKFERKKIYINQPSKKKSLTVRYSSIFFVHQVNRKSSQPKQKQKSSAVIS